MAEPVLNELLLSHLVDEFGTAGERSVEFLRTADLLVRSAGGETPRDGSLIAYALREALKGLAVARSSGEGGEWKVRSREVVAAKSNFVAARALDQEAGEEALRNLLLSIDRLGETHQQESVHARRMIAVVVERSGVEPLRRLGPVEEYQALLGDLDQGLHGLISTDKGLDLWRRAVAVLSRLFLPPQARFEELDALAAVSDPGSAEVERLLSLLVGSNHLRHFLQKISDPGWIDLLLDDGELLEPISTSTGWPVASVFARLSATHGERLALQLTSMSRRWVADEQAAWHLAIASLELGEHGQSVLLGCLRQHRQSRAITSFAIESATRNDKSNAYVAEVADLVLSRESFSVDPHSSTEIMAALVEGATPENVLGRLRLVCYKLKRMLAVAEYNWIEYDYSTLGRGRAASNGPLEPVAELVDRLVRLVRIAISAGCDFATLDEVVGVLASPFMRRVRAWLIAESGDQVAMGERVEFIRSAISARGPTADDAAIVRSVLADANPNAYESAWSDSLPTAPSVAEVGEALASGSLNPRWREMFRWYAVLPRNITNAWVGVITVLAGRFGGEPDETVFEPPFDGSAGGALWGSSPISVEDLSGYSIEDAVRYLRDWRPDPSNRMQSARDLARVFEDVVKGDVPAWGAEPLQRAVALRHPTYVHHYLSGLARVDVESDANQIDIVGLTDLIDLVFAGPWPASPIGSDSFEFDHDWRPSQEAAISLIQKLAEMRVSFDGVADRIWTHICRAVRNRDDSSGITGDVGLLERAINRPCTRALETAIHFIAAENSDIGSLREGFLDLLDEVLALDGVDGREFRAIVAPRLRFLDRIIPDWVSRSKSSLVGNDAPDGLDHVLVDMSLKWGTPPDWLLIEYQAMVEDAIERDVENAVDHYVISMLRKLEGYSLQHASCWLFGTGKVAAAAKALGRVLGIDGITEEMAHIALELWDFYIVDHPEVAGHFGELYRASLIGDNDWLLRVDRTVNISVSGGAISSPERVMERMASMRVSRKVLEVADRIVRLSLEPWERYSVERTALAVVRGVDPADRDSAEYRRLFAAMLERGHDL